MVAYYAETSMVGKLWAGFQQVLLFKFSEIFYKYCHDETALIKIQQRKVKRCSHIKIPTNYFIKEIAQVGPSFGYSLTLE